MQVTQQAFSPHFLRYAGGTHPHGQQQALRVGQNEAFMAPYLFAHIVAPVPVATGCRSDALRVHDTGRSMGLTVSFKPYLSH